MRDNHDVGLEIVRVRKRTMARERAESGAEERVRQDAEAVELDERGRVTNEPDLDRRNASALRFSAAE
jgi:hypothetical protein